MYRPDPKPALQELPSRSSKSGTGLLVLIPTRGQIAVETFTALNENFDGLTKAILTVPRRPVVEARNSLWKMACEGQSQLPWSEAYGLLVDDDVFWLPGTVAKMIDTMRAYPQIEVLSGAYGPRLPFARIHANRVAGRMTPPTPGVNCQLGEIVEVQECGLGFAMFRLDMLSKLSADPFDTITDSEIGDLGEDFSFCRRVRKAGLRIFCATGAVIAHVDPRDGVAYIPGDTPHRVIGRELHRISGEHLVVKTAEERVY